MKSIVDRIEKVRLRQNGEVGRQQGTAEGKLNVARGTRREQEVPIISRCRTACAYYCQREASLRK